MRTGRQRELENTRMWVGKPGPNPRQSGSSVLTLNLWALGGIYPPDTHTHCSGKGVSLVFPMSESSCHVSRRYQEKLNDTLGLWWSKWGSKSWPSIGVWFVGRGQDRDKGNEHPGLMVPPLSPCGDGRRKVFSFFCSLGKWRYPWL